MENDPPQGRKGKKHYKELELSSVFSKNSDFVIGCGLGAQIDPKECLFIDQQNPAQTNRIMNKCFSFIQVLKNMGSVREFMCSKQQFTDCTPFLNQLVLTLKNSCQPNEIQEGTRLANLVETLKLDEKVFFQEIIEKIVREIQESNQNQTHEKLLKELTPWSIWFKDNNNFYTHTLYSQISLTKFCPRCQKNETPIHQQLPVLQLNFSALDTQQDPLNPRNYSIIDVLIIIQGDNLEKRQLKPLQIVLESKKYILADIIQLIKEKEPGEYTLVDMSNAFKINHVFTDQTQFITLKPNQRFCVYAYKTCSKVDDQKRETQLQFIYVRSASGSEKSILPPIAIRKCIKYPLNNLFLTIFRSIKRDLLKHCPEKLYFHQLTPDDEAFLIHFLKPNERAPIFKLKVVYPSLVEQVFEYPHDNLTIPHPKEISIIFEDNSIVLALTKTMIEMAAMVKNIKETKPEMNIPGVNRATLQELFRVNYQSEKQLAETCNVCHTVVQQKVQILRMPEFAIFSLNRYCSVGQNQLKFQLDLDISLQDFNIIGQRYDLVTVVTRVKSEPTQLENEGFLIAYNRNIVTNEWHAYSNSLVYKVSFEEIEINRNSLYLIYKHIKSQ